MVETVDELLELLQVHKGKKLLITDKIEQSKSFLFDIEEKDGVCLLVKSIRDYY